MSLVPVSSVQETNVPVPKVSVPIVRCHLHSGFDPVAVAESCCTGRAPNKCAVAVPKLSVPIVPW